MSELIITSTDDANRKYPVHLSNNGELNLAKEDLMILLSPLTDLCDLDFNTPIEQYLLADGVCEQLPEDERMDNAFSIHEALFRLLSRYVQFSKSSVSDEELVMLNRDFEGESTHAVNESIKAFLPSILARINLINQWSPRSEIKLKITRIGEYIELSKPWVIPFSEPGLLVDFSHYVDHQATINENGSITFTHLVDADGNEFYSCIDTPYVRDDHIDYPFIQGLHADPEGDNWICLKPKFDS